MNRNFKVSLLPVILIGISTAITLAIAVQNRTAVDGIKTDGLSLVAIVVSLVAALTSIIAVFLVENTKHRVLLSLFVIAGALMAAMAYLNYGLSQV